MEENNEKGGTRDLFHKIQEIKGKFKPQDVKRSTQQYSI